MTAERLQKMDQVLRWRQNNLTVILEDVHDVHNISAVLRSCDSVGCHEVYTVNTLAPPAHKMAKRSSAGTRKWMEVYSFDNIEECMTRVKDKYENIYATHLGEEAKELYDLDLTGSVALLFGNEAFGLSKKILEYATGNFVIPQMGMAQSLNISVACAVSLYEALRQRKVAYAYDTPTIPESQRVAIKDYWVARDLER